MSACEVNNPPVKRRNWRSYWVRTMVSWHWISSAICLIGMLLFAVTGITLNHASQIEARPRVDSVSAVLPSNLLELIASQDTSETEPSTTATASVPMEVAAWVKDKLGVDVMDRAAEWNEEEIYISMPGPGSDAWLSIERVTGDIEFERTWRGWVAYLNDLHKGRHTGTVWSWFLDIFAVATLIFCGTGLFLLWAHAKHRRLTWPLVGLGFVVPLLIAMLFIH